VKKRQKSQAVRISSPDALAERGTEDLKAERFKEAVDCFRQLVKVEPRPEWRKSLATAYAGRARSLAAKGMVKEAAMVFDNAIDADGSFHEPLVHLACLIRTDDNAKAAALCARLLADEAEGVTDAERTRVADLAAALWLAGHPPPSESERLPAKAHDAAEKALGAWIDGAPAETVDGLLNAIPLRSPFKPLRLIVKGLITTGGDADRRDKLLDMVPASSAFGALARAVRLAGTADPQRMLAEWGDLSTAARAFVAEIGGRPPTSARRLTDLIEAERRGPETLFDVLVKNTAHFAEADLRAACLNLLPAAPRRFAQFERRFSTLPAAEKHRILALEAGRRKHWDPFEDHWLDYVRELENAPVPDRDLVRSVVFRHLADTALEVPAFKNPYPGTDDRIAEWLKQSIEADPTDRDGLLTLIARLRETGDVKERNRWTDIAVERFPADPAILTEALESTAERGAFRKAATLAEKLLKADPINALARQRLIELRIAHARKKLREGRADLAGRELEEAARRERRTAPESTLTIARGLVAVRAGRLDEGWAGVRNGVEQLGGGVPGWLRALFEARAMGFTDQELKALRRDLTAAMRADPTPPAIIAALGLLNRREFRDIPKLPADGLKLIRRWLDKGSDCAFSTAEFQTGAEIFERLEAFELLMKYATAALARAPDEPLYEFYRIFARTRGNSYLLTPVEVDRLESLAEKVGRNQDATLGLQIIQFLEGDLRSPLHAFDFDDLDDDFADDPFGEPFAGAPGPGAAELDMMEAMGERIFELLELHPPGNVVDIMMKEFQSSPVAPNVPEPAVRSLLEMLVNVAATERRRQTKPSRSRGRNRRSRR
jgi:tetratricopeptide (TPR) repeat protein